MKNNALRIVGLILCLTFLMSLVACVNKEEPVAQHVDGNALFQALLENVSFETEIKDTGENGLSYFTNLPDSAQVRFYTDSAYYADCLALITVADTNDRNAAVRMLYDYVDQMTEHFRNYHPEQVSKCNNAVIWSEDVYAILCITSDSENAKNIVRNAGEYAAQYADKLTNPTVAIEPQQTEPEQTTMESTAPHSQQPEGEYPVLTSKTGVLSDYGKSHYRVDDMAFMPYSYREESARNYADIVNAASIQFGGDINVYNMLIPTAIGIVLPDDIRANMSDYEDQKARIEQVYGMLDESIIEVNVFDNLMRHRDEYLYFRTDFHWTGTAAYYAYESFCRVKGITPYTLEQRKVSVFDNFMGNLYENSQITPDEVYAYHPYYADRISMVFTNRDGEEMEWDVIKDVSSWPENAKYNTFAGGDQPIAIYENAAVSEGVAIVIKESFGNALLPYLVDHYSIIYEIDYRYWEGNIAEFAQEKGVNDVIFANNMGMVSTATLVAMLADNF